MNHPRVELLPGAIVAGKYRIERIIGEGGMGTVVAARAPDGSAVAIKWLLPVHRDEPRIIARFLRESRVTARLKSEHVARVLDAGEIPAADGAPALDYVVMEYLDGRDLRSVAAALGTLTAWEAAGYVSQACVGLAEAHALGIIHRDLKPANLFLTRGPDRRPLVKVLDFGIAKFESPNVAGDAADMTEDAAMMGSMQYMAPEQMLDARTVDARADVRSLGVILYTLVSGQRPFVGETTADVAFAVLTAAARPLGPLRPDLPAGFEAVVARCMARRREDRYANMAELSRALAPFTRRGADAPIGELTLRTLPLDGPARDTPSTERMPGAEAPIDRAPRYNLDGPATERVQSGVDLEETIPERPSKTIVPPAQGDATPPAPTKSARAEQMTTQRSGIMTAPIAPAVIEPAAPEPAVTEQVALDPVVPEPASTKRAPRRPRERTLGKVVALGMIGVAVGSLVILEAMLFEEPSVDAASSLEIAGGP